jgi:hypothetical protein
MSTPAASISGSRSSVRSSSRRDASRHAPGWAIDAVLVPAYGNLGTAAAAARHYLQTLHADLAGTGVYAGLLQVSGPVGDSDAGNFVIEAYGAANLPEPQKPADLAAAMWDLYLKRDRFEQVFGA